LRKGHPQVRKFQDQPAHGHASPEKLIKDGKNRPEKKPVSLDGPWKNPPADIYRYAVRIPNLQSESPRAAVMAAQVPSSLFNQLEQNGFQPSVVDFVPVQNFCH
jgi:hypothetical protein